MTPPSNPKQIERMGEADDGVMGGVTTIEEHKEEVGGRSLGGGSRNMLV
jgi:hypothetical protein